MYLYNTNLWRVIPSGCLFWLLEQKLALQLGIFKMILKYF